MTLGVSLSGTAVAAAPPTIMQGAPPASADVVTARSWLTAPHLAWGLTHVEQVVHVATVDHGDAPATPLGPLWLDVSKFVLGTRDGRHLNLDAALDALSVQALLVWQDGSLRLERYRGAHGPRTRHALLTASASVTGLLAEMLIDAKRFDDMRLVTFYLPELKGSAWDNVSVRETLDMEVALDFREIYGDPWSDVSQLLMAGGLLGPEPGFTPAPSLNEYLHGVRGQGEHSAQYQYASANMEVIGWIMQRATGQSLAALFGEHLHGRLGAERDALFATDAVGMTVASAGLALTARDWLRLGIMLQQDGQANLNQVVEPRVVEKLFAGGPRRHAMPGREDAPFFSFRGGWHVDHASGAIGAWGIHGQFLFIAPRAKIVVVMQSAHPEPYGPHWGLAEELFQALVEYLNRGL